VQSGVSTLSFGVLCVVAWCIYMITGCICCRAVAGPKEMVVFPIISEIRVFFVSRVREHAYVVPM
jgi:hypothetical protein